MPEPAAISTDWNAFGAQRMRDSVDAIRAQRASLYVRERDLPALLGVISEEDAVLKWLESAQAGERSLGASGHSAYRLNRHMALNAAILAERAAQEARAL